MKQWQGALCVLIGAATFGFTPIFAKSGLAAGFSLGEINVVQMLIAFLVLWGVVLIKKPSFKNLTKVKAMKLMIAGTFIGMTSVFYYGSMQYLPASLAIILLFQFIWVGIVLEWLFERIKPTIKTIISLILALIGVFFAANVISGDIYGFPVIGIVFGFLSAFTYAGFIFASGRVAEDVSPYVRSPIMISGSLVLILVIFSPSVEMTATLDRSLWFYALGVAFFGAILPPLLFAIGSPHISGGLATILSSIELPVAIIMTKIVFSEVITPQQWFGIILILLAIMVTEMESYFLRIKKAIRFKG